MFNSFYTINMQFSEHDLLQFSRQGVSLSQVEKQLQSFREGFPFLPLACAATPHRGIKVLSVEDEETYIERWNTFCLSPKKVFKFVPASGAASRMFKDLYAFIDAPYDTPTTSFEQLFFSKITHFAFFEALNRTCLEQTGKDIEALLVQNKHKEVVRLLLSSSGLNYGALPKGLLAFHRYSDGSVRTPFEEHLAEGARYATTQDQVLNIHFTVSPEHKSLFSQLAKSRGSARMHIEFSEQKSYTDTIAVDKENNPFRLPDGTILFRPAGHGALIENLNEIDADIIFVKNIDNVLPDGQKEEETHYKKVLAGVLVSVQEQIFNYLKELEKRVYTHQELLAIATFVEEVLCVHFDPSDHTVDGLQAFLQKILNRPLRVCGMVKNMGEPGGGPFIARNSDGTYSPQILESSQLNPNDSHTQALLKQGTHFNPVDIVCGVKSYQGEKFDLTAYVDPLTGFISNKSKDGKVLKALELPGLWNGAMAHWNTIFVEVPVSTFNPVKTVNDLLRPQHQM